MVHFPDSVFRFVEVLASGLLLGVMAHRSGSCVTSMPSHVLGNWKVVATLAWLT